MYKKIISLIVAILFLVNNLSFGLGAMPLSARATDPARVAMYEQAASLWGENIPLAVKLLLETIDEDQQDDISTTFEVANFIEMGIIDEIVLAKIELTQKGQRRVVVNSGFINSWKLIPSDQINKELIDIFKKDTKIVKRDGQTLVIVNVDTSVTPSKTGELRIVELLGQDIKDKSSILTDLATIANAPEELQETARLIYLDPEIQELNPTLALTEEGVIEITTENIVNDFTQMNQTFQIRGILNSPNSVEGFYIQEIILDKISSHTSEKDSDGQRLLEKIKNTRRWKCVFKAIHEKSKFSDPDKLNAFMQDLNKKMFQDQYLPVEKFIEKILLSTDAEAIINNLDFFNVEVSLIEGTKYELTLAKRSVQINIPFSNKEDARKTLNYLFSEEEDIAESTQVHQPKSGELDLKMLCEMAPDAEVDWLVANVVEAMDEHRYEIMKELQKALKNDVDKLEAFMDALTEKLFEEENTSKELPVQDERIEKLLSLKDTESIKAELKRLGVEVLFEIGNKHKLTLRQRSVSINIPFLFKDNARKILSDLFSKRKDVETLFLAEQPKSGELSIDQLYEMAPSATIEWLIANVVEATDKNKIEIIWTIREALFYQPKKQVEFNKALEVELGQPVVEDVRNDSKPLLSEKPISTRDKIEYILSQKKRRALKKALERFDIKVSWWGSNTFKLTLWDRQISIDIPVKDKDEARKALNFLFLEERVKEELSELQTGLRSELSLDVAGYISERSKLQGTIIGVPKEIKANAERVGLTPWGVKFFSACGIRVLVEKGAGRQHFTDQEYIAAGAQMVDTAQEIYEQATLIKKVKEPLSKSDGSLPSECELLERNPGKTIFTYLHLAASELRSLVTSLLKGKWLGIAYETISVLKDGKWTTPALEPMSIIAGDLAGLFPASFLSEPGEEIDIDALNKASHQKMAGVKDEYEGNHDINRLEKPLTKSLNDKSLEGKSAVVLGGGISGRRMALRLLQQGANVTITDVKKDVVLALNKEFKEKYKDKFTAWQVPLDINNVPDELMETLRSADILGGCILVPGATAPQMTEELFKSITEDKPKLIIDIAIDQGGNFPGGHSTYYDEPVFLDEYNNTRFCVANMPDFVGRIASIELEKSTIGFALALAMGQDDANALFSSLEDAVNTQDGEIVHQGVKDAYEKELVDDLMIMNEAESVTKSVDELMEGDQTSETLAQEETSGINGSGFAPHSVDGSEDIDNAEEISTESLRHLMSTKASNASDSAVDTQSKEGDFKTALQAQPAQANEINGSGFAPQIVEDESELPVITDMLEKEPVTDPLPESEDVLREYDGTSEAIAEAPSDAEHQRLISEIYEWIVKISNNEVPELSKKDEENLGVAKVEAIFKLVNLLHNDKIEILIPQQEIQLTDVAHDAIKAIGKKTENFLGCDPYSDIEHLEQLLEIGDEKSSDVKRLIITIGEKSKKEIQQLLQKRPELFKGKRLLNIKLPNNYKNMKSRKKTVWQVDMFTKAIFASIYVKDGRMESFLIRGVLKDFFQDEVSNIEVFLDELGKPIKKYESTDDIKKRINYFLQEIVSLVPLLGHKLRIMRQFLTYA